jgi:hypothetical protein
MANFTWNGFPDLDAALKVFQNPPAEPLMIEWRYELVEDNEYGVMHGIDGWDQHVADVTYRPVPPHKHAPKASRLLPNNNLAPEVYRQLTGPALAPRGRGSRIITTLETEHATRAPWSVAGAWFNVISAKGKPFLEHLFDGDPGQNLPARDMRRLRDRGYNRCLDLTEKWADWLLKKLFP